jgi:membrane-bound lytic murein transglycosylase A
MNLRTSKIFSRQYLCLIASVAIVACMPRDTAPEFPAEIRESPPREIIVPGAAELHLTRVQFSLLANWEETDLSGSSCDAITSMAEDTIMGGAGYGGTAADWKTVCAVAANISAADGVAVRNFFESEFVPYRVMEGEREDGLFTGYYEPELLGSTIRQGAFQTPLHGLPADLVSVDLGLFRDNLMGQRVAGRISDGRLVPYATRAEITRNGLNQAEELLYIDDPVDAFFLAIQGSGRVRLQDGSVVRAAYAGQNGHPYTAIGAVLIRQGEMTREEVSMQSIRSWLDAHPDRAQELLEQNDSYIFFSIEPLLDPTLGARGTEGVPLTATASLAVDASAHPLGAPIWLETTAPQDGEPETSFHRLLIAQDTGGAINGALRGDIYWGVGEEAGEIAGRMRSTGKMAVLLPRIIAERLGQTFPPAEPRP